MKTLRLLAVAGIAALCCLATLIHAAEVTNERPFGGPFPPKKRGMVKVGTTCKTPKFTCTFPEAQPVDTSCSCRGSDGKPVSGKVVE
jgi:hypothetical protein